MRHHRFIVATVALLAIGLLAPGVGAQACLHGMACASMGVPMEMPSAADHCGGPATDEGYPDSDVVIGAECCGVAAPGDLVAPEAVTSSGTTLPSPEKTTPASAALPESVDTYGVASRPAPEERARTAPSGRDLLVLHQAFLN